MIPAASQPKMDLRARVFQGFLMLKKRERDPLTFSTLTFPDFRSLTGGPTRCGAHPSVTQSQGKLGLAKSEDPAPPVASRRSEMESCTMGSDHLRDAYLVLTMLDKQKFQVS